MNGRSVWYLPAAPLVERLKPLEEQNSLREIAAAASTRSWAANFRQIGRVKSRVYITLWEADRICCEILRVHPYEVYGDAWLLPQNAQDIGY